MVADVGDPIALTEITRRFQHESSDEREAAILALTSITPVGDHDMMNLVEVHHVCVCVNLVEVHHVCVCVNLVEVHHVCVCVCRYIHTFTYVFEHAYICLFIYDRTFVYIRARQSFFHTHPLHIHNIILPRTSISFFHTHPSHIHYIILPHTFFHTHPLHIHYRTSITPVGDHGLV